MNRSRGGFSRRFRVDSSVSRRIPRFHLKNRRTFTLFTTIPLLGVIKAGYPMPAFVQEDTSLNLHTLFAGLSSECFALTVSGDSMLDEGIYDGDIVIVDKEVEPTNGAIVAACVDEEWTVKFFKREEGRVTLAPANSKYPVITPRVSLEIGGVVVNVIRSYR